MIQFFKNNFSFGKLITYMIRWQLSTPILGIVTYWFTHQNPLNSLGSAFVANIIGSLIFFWVDVFIFLRNTLTTQWEVIETGTCCDCKNEARLYRLVLTPKYNRINSIPKFRCEKCSIKKFNQLKKGKYI